MQYDSHAVLDPGTISVMKSEEERVGSEQTDEIKTITYLQFLIVPPLRRQINLAGVYTRALLPAMMNNGLSKRGQVREFRDLS